ncbi:MAG: hypothetical protein KZQ83_15030 [gamma proteobacterium symbiont of Taylorina sp.]|nr:hypothetical protein [gamma proteobacterium symbiont of Taylorina sp.]
MSDQLLISAVKKLEIDDISLASCNVCKKDDFVPTFNKDVLNIQFINMLTGHSLGDINNNDDYVNVIIYHYMAGFRALPKDLPEDIASNEESLKKRILVEVKAEFNAIYFMKEELTEEEINVFGASNVGFNVWPYWREFASSISTRMRLPNFIIPFKRMREE